MAKVKDKEMVELLRYKSLQLRIDSIRATTVSGSGHPTSCLSIADVITTLFFYQMKFDLWNPKNKNNDRFILSKGHAIPVIYAAYKQLGVISDEQLMLLRNVDSPLEGHPTPRFIYNEAATGSLGQGLAIGAGFALAAKQDCLNYKTYVVLGDGEIAEGSVWEAAEFAAYYKLNNIIGIVDCNKLGQTGETLQGHDVENYANKFRAFGWKTFVIDGHDIEEIIKAFEEVNEISNQPVMIVAKTYKGYGLEEIQNKNGYHGKPFKKEELDFVIDCLKKKFKRAFEYKEKSFADSAKLDIIVDRQEEICLPTISVNLDQDKNESLFNQGKTIATRKAYGYALSAIGKQNDNIVVLDADVKNSTYTEIFEKDFPDKFIQCFIAEQTMISVATGLQSRGKIPFIATFGAFLTRAHDQIRMAGIGKNALRICGSHCGVSIGQDGPSQMGLEDLAMMRAIPDSIVLYPSDGVSAYKLVECMANYHKGISYLRTTRMTTSILYDKNEEFVIGGCKVIRQSENDQACIVAAGITLHEALAAYERLKQDKIFVSVIDAYSVKPLDRKTICSVAKQSRNRIIVVEDHYVCGGLGEAVASAVTNDAVVVEQLAVKNVSRSGKPEELLSYAQIDTESIVGQIKFIG